MEYPPELPSEMCGNLQEPHAQMQRTLFMAFPRFFVFVGVKGSTLRPNAEAGARPSPGHCCLEGTVPHSPPPLMFLSFW